MKRIMASLAQLLLIDSGGLADFLLLMLFDGVDEDD